MRRREWGPPQGGQPSGPPGPPGPPPLPSNTQAGYGHPGFNAPQGFPPPWQQGYAPRPHQPPPYQPGYPPQGQPPSGAWPGRGQPPAPNPSTGGMPTPAAAASAAPVSWRRLPPDRDGQGVGRKRQADRALPNPSQRGRNADGNLIPGSDVVRINKALVDAGKQGNVQAVLQTVATNADKMNGVNVASAVRNVAEALDRCRTPRPGVLAVLQDARFHHQLMALVEAKMKQFTAWNVSQIVWAWGKLGYADLRPELRELLLSTFLWHLQNPDVQVNKRVKPQELKNVIHACATMRQPLDDELLQTSVKEALRFMRDQSIVFKPQEVANIMWAYAKLEVEFVFCTRVLTSDLLEELAQAAATRVLSSLRDASGQHIANLVWAFAKLEIVPAAEDLFRLLDHLKDVQLEPQNTTNSIYALAKLVTLAPTREYLRSEENRAKLLESFNILEKEIVRMAPQAAPQDVGNTIWALGTLQRENLTVAADDTIQALHTAVVRLSLDEFKPQELKDVLWGFAHMGIQPDMTVLEKFEETIIAQPDVFGPQEVANIVWAMARLKTDAFSPSPRLLVSLCHAIVNKLEMFNPQNLITALYGFSSLTPPDGPMWAEFLAKVTAVAVGMLPQFNAHQVSNCLWSLAKLQAILSIDFITAFANRLDEVLASVKAQELANAMHSFAQFHERRRDVAEDNRFDNKGSAHSRSVRWPANHQLANLLACAQSALEFGDAQNVSNVLWAVAKLNYTPDEQFMQWVTHTIVHLIDEFNTQELVNIMWSLGSLAYEPPTILFRELERVYQQMVDAGLFNTQDMANLLWGYATLGRAPAPTLLQSIAAQAVLHVDAFKHFELVNVLWGFAMLGMDPGPRLWTSGRARLRQCRTEQFRPEGLCMLWHTHVLALARNWPITLFGDFTVEAGNTAEAEAAARMAVSTLGVACERQWRRVASETIVSSLHRDVRNVLCRVLGVGLVRSEFPVGGLGETPGLLTADLHVEWRGQALVVEVDGPAHFTVNTQQPLGKTLARNLLLACRVPRLANVPFFDWDAIRADNGDLEGYLQNALDHTLAHSRYKVATEVPRAVPLT